MSAATHMKQRHQEAPGPVLPTVIATPGPPAPASPPGAFTEQIERDLEQVGLLASLLAGAATVQVGLTALGAHTASMVPVATLLSLSLFYGLLARRWRSEWLVYLAEVSFSGSYYLYRSFHPFTPGVDATLLLLFSFLHFAMSETFERLGWHYYSRPMLYFSMLLTLTTLLLALVRGRLDDVSLSIVFSAGSFYALVSYRKRWKRLAYAAAVLYNAFLWLAWQRVGWALADHPQNYLVPIGLTAVLYAEANRRDLGPTTLDGLRGLGSMLMYVSTAVPMWQFRSFGAWLTLLLLSLGGIFVGVWLRVQSFLWLGLICFVFDVGYQVGRVGIDHAQAKWIIMLALALLIVGGVALNEKVQIWTKLRALYVAVRAWR